MNKKIKFYLKYIFIAILSLIILIPLWYVVVNSFKTPQEAAKASITLPTEYKIVENYSKVINVGNIAMSFFNSLILTISSTAIILFISSLSAYVISRRKDRKTKYLFYLIMLGMMMPPSIIIIAILFKYLHLLGTYQGMILFYSAVVTAFPTFILTGFMSTIPREIEESALIDGAKPLSIYFYIILPLLKPSLLTSFVYCFMVIWNDFMYPFYLLAGSPKKYTITLSVFNFQSQYQTQWNLVFADLILICLPVIIVFIIANRQITEGMTAGAIKG